MDIIYQTLLNNYPTFKNANSDYVQHLEPISLDEITALESTYNGGQPFPTSLRELLFLAENFCHVLDYGLFNTQAEMQVGARKWLTRSNRSIDRPFFVVDVYNGVEQFLFIYLDEDQNDPKVYEAFLPIKNGVNFIDSLNQTFSAYVTRGMKALLSGRNPF